MWNETESSQLGFYVGSFTLTLLFFPGLTFILGVSPILTTTIVLCFLIVLITTGGCALHLREIERLEEAEALIETREKVDLHIKGLHETLSHWKPRVESCAAATAEGSSFSLDIVRGVATAREVIRALEVRLETLVACLLEGGEHQIFNAADISESAVEIGTPEGTEPLPALESHLWRDTLELLLSDAEQHLRVKQDEAA